MPENEIPIEYLRVIQTSEGNHGVWNYIGKTLAFNNRVLEGSLDGVLKRYVGRYEHHPQPSKPGHEDLYARLVEIHADLSTFAPQELREAASDKSDFSKWFRAHVKVPLHFCTLSIGSSNAGADPVESYKKADSKIKEEAEKQLKLNFLGEGGFDKDKPVLWVKLPGYENPYVVDKIPITSPVPIGRRIVSVEKASLDTLFCPYWAGNLYENDNERKEVDDFVDQTGARFFGVACTMWDLKLFGEKELVGFGTLGAKPEYREDYNELIDGANLNLVDASTAIRKTIKSFKIKGSKRNLYRAIEDEIKKQIGGRDVNEVIEEKIRPYLERYDEKNVLSVQKEYSDKMFGIRKMFLNSMLPKWKESMIDGIETAFMNFSYIAGWDKGDVKFEKVMDRGIEIPKFYYMDVALDKRAAFKDEENGMYSVLFMVPNNLIDSKNPMKAGIKLNNGVIGYVANIIPVIGGRVYSEQAHTNITAMIAVGSGFEGI